MRIETFRTSIEAVQSQNAVMRREFDSYEQFYDWFSYSMTLRLRDLGGQGILLEPGDDGELMTFMDPFLEIPDGVSGYVFGVDNEFIGELRLEKEDFFYRGIILYQEEERKFSAFDRIYLRINSLTEEGSVE